MLILYINVVSFLIKSPSGVKSFPGIWRSCRLAAGKRSAGEIFIDKLIIIYLSIHSTFSPCRPSRISQTIFAAKTTTHSWRTESSPRRGGSRRPGSPSSKVATVANFLRKNLYQPLPPCVESDGKNIWRPS